ncbi:hypothetical protein [Phenylobacterium sp.]|uniref:hypothetical protein n=1 Tax=Phenylobacterium sp. TaxID=1871053 RepID=UPI0030F4994E
MILNPVRLYNRWLRMRGEALEEAQMLRRRHGDEALEAARAKLTRADLSSWGRRVMQETVKTLEKA